jgi:hypothetical protein
MTLTELQQLAASVGFPDEALAAAVAMAESGGNPEAFGDPQFGGSVGLWQINLPAHPNYDPSSLTDPTYNAHAAFDISSGGTNWNPWTTYRTGAYLQFYKPAQPPAQPAQSHGGAVFFAIAAAAAAALVAVAHYRPELVARVRTRIMEVF